MSKLSPIRRENLPTILAVNTQYEEMLSPLSMTELESLVEDAFFARQVGDGAAFIIAFDQAASYEGENFSWFKERYPKFVYVDRIAIGESHQRQGLARTFYEHLIAFSKSHGAPIVCAEVNIAPPNPASHAFHLNMGFKAVGDAHAHGKHVQYYAKKI